MPSSPFEKKSAYHSELVRASERNGLEVTVKSDVLKSKFKDNGKDSYYVVIEVAGSEHQLKLENQECENAMSNLKNQTVILTATGSRDEARITVEDAGDAPPQQRSAPPQQRQSAPPAQGPRMALICGTTPEARVLRQKISA